MLHTGAADDEADDDEAPMCVNGCMAVSSQKSCSFESVLQLRAVEASNPCVVRWRRRRGPRGARHVPARLVQILKRCPSHQTLTSVADAAYVSRQPAPPPRPRPQRVDPAVRRYGSPGRTLLPVLRPVVDSTIGVPVE